MIAAVFYKNMLGISNQAIHRASACMTIILTAGGPSQQRPIKIYIFFLSTSILIRIQMRLASSTSWRYVVHNNLSRDMRKPVCGVSDWARYKPACTVTEEG